MVIKIVLSLTPKTNHMFDIKEITKKCRDMYPMESYRLLKMYGYKFMSWGGSNFTHVGRTEAPLDINKPTKIGKALKFRVKGHHHKGWVYMTCNGSDLYDVYLVSHEGELVKKLDDLYFDQVFEEMDKAIEHIPVYGEN